MLFQVAKSFGGRLRHMLGGLGRKGIGNERQSDHDVLHVPDDSIAPMTKVSYNTDYNIFRNKRSI